MNGQTKSNADTRVVVAMSGGVDSSVAAALLVEQGYDVVGMMMRLWSEPGREAFNRCCTPDQMADARRIANQLGIPFYVLDTKEHFKQTIVQFFMDEYAAGRTPNPCIECNRQIRFDFLLNQARSLGADYLATGHYAQIQHSNGRYELHRGVDPSKDQSYVLHVLTQELMAQVMFPIGGYAKTRVREMAAEFALPVAKKSDSMDLCFLGKDSYQSFLQRNAPDIATPGPIMTREGDQLGQHNGLPYYTIGQRKGLGISAREPMFVLDKDASSNALIVGTKRQLGRTQLTAKRVNWLDGAPPVAPVQADTMIRYKSTRLPATIEATGDGSASVTFDEPAFGIAPGQGAVFFDGTRVLGGGIIAATEQVAW